MFKFLRSISSVSLLKIFMVYCLFTDFKNYPLSILFTL